MGGPRVPGLTPWATISRPFGAEGKSMEMDAEQGGGLRLALGYYLSPLWG